MKIVKPLRLMALPRPYRWRNETHLAVTIAALIEHKGEQQHLMPEYTLVNEVLPGLDSDEVIDFVMPKPHPEYMVSGYAYTRQQDDKTSCMVSVRVDDKRKDGLVFGDRYWTGNTMSDPMPFDSMPLNWANSFGGAGYPDNPLGTGLDSIAIEPGLHAIRLPNLESPIDRVRDRGQIVKPFNFGQIPIDWPHRAEKMGNYDQKWLENVGTGFFDDMQPILFNAASPDQVWSDRDALRMDESFAIRNMHPELDCWSGVLPPLRARAFIERRGCKGVLDEIAMRATTVWFIPHRCSYVLLFHGSIPIEDDDAYDVSALMVALERIGEVRNNAHYHDVFRARCDHTQASLFAFRDEDLLPSDYLGAGLEQLPIDSHAMMSKIKQHMEGGPDGARGSFVGPIKPMTLGDLPALVERNNRELDILLDEHKRERHEAMTEKLPVDASNDEKFVHALKRRIHEEADLSSGITRPHISQSGPPSLSQGGLDMSAVETRRTLRGLAKDAHGSESTLGEMYNFARRSLNKMYLYSVQFQDGVARVDEHRAIALRRRLLARYEKGRNLSGMNLTGADLSGMDLQGADFSESWLEGADFSDCNLAGVIFRETVLARADFQGACLDRVKMDQSNISEARFDGNSFAGAYIGNVIAQTPVVFRNCRFHQATLEDFNSEDMAFESCTFEATRVNHVHLTRTVIRNCRYEACSFEKMSLDAGMIEDVTMADCTLISCDFDKTELVRWDLLKCRVTKLTLDEGMVLVQPVFSDCHFTQSLFREVRFESANFVNTTLEQCDFSLAVLEACRLEHVQTPLSTFVRTNFDLANLSGSNLMNGNFQKARFVGANLSRCNLFRADMSETLLDASTLVDQAYLQGTRTVPKRRDSTLN